MKILGLDPSLTSTGVAVITHDLRVTTHRVESAPPKRAKGDKTPATVEARAARIRAIAASINVVHALQYDGILAVIEGPSYGSVGGAQWDRAWLWGAIVDKLVGNDIPVAVVPPMVRAKWATGSGAAGKSLVAANMARLWPTLDAGISEDEWDAVALASLGAQHLGILPVELARHREQLAKVAWPELVSA